MPIRLIRLAMVAAGVGALIAIPATGPARLAEDAAPASVAEAAAVATTRVVLGGGRSYLLADPGALAQPTGAPRLNQTAASPPAAAAKAGAGPDGPPLLIALHGRTDRPATFVARTGLSKVAAAGGAVLVAPETAPGLRVRSWNAGSCCDDARDSVDDVTFLAAVIRDAVSRTGADPDRVFLVGFSNGAMLGYRVACERPDLIDALVAVSGQRMVTGCAPETTPLLVIQGGKDHAVPAAGVAWSTLLKARVPSTAESIAPFERPDVRLLPAAGHRWPTAADGAGFDATSQLWQWLGDR